MGKNATDAELHAREVSEILTRTAARNAWLTPEIRERYAEAAAPYATATVEQLIETGAIDFTPAGEFVLLRAIIAADAARKDEGEPGAVERVALDDVAVDARKCEAHRVVAVGAAVDAWLDGRKVPEEKKIRVGDDAFVVTAAADRVTKTDMTCRLWLCHIEDVEAWWRRKPTAGQ